MYRYKFISCYWWVRSANYNNNNNFCNVNTDGSANNNNANNSRGLVPDFKDFQRSHGVALSERRPILKGEILPEPKGRNRRLIRLHERRFITSVHGWRRRLPPVSCAIVKQVRGAIQSLYGRRIYFNYEQKKRQIRAPQV